MSEPPRPRNVSFTIPGDVLLALNEIARARNCTRAALIREAIAGHLRRTARVKLDASERPAFRSFQHKREHVAAVTPEKAHKIAVNLPPHVSALLNRVASARDTTPKHIVRDALRVYIRKNGYEPLPKRKLVTPHIATTPCAALKLPGALLNAASHHAELTDITLAESIRRAVATYLRRVCRIPVSREDTRMLVPPRRNTPRSFDPDCIRTVPTPFPRALYDKLLIAARRRKTVISDIVARALTRAYAR